MKTIEQIKQLLSQSLSTQAIDAANELTQCTSVDAHTLATAYYLRGNAYRQCGQVRMALNSYLEAMELEPDGPASDAYRMTQEILDFYNHDLYNP